jgi:exodeoxyribonuclease V alpha subunit
MDFDETQLLAIDRCLRVGNANRVAGVTGEAGTGKTTILKKVHDEFVARGKTVVLCAPTGKAAKRIKEATGIDAMTIHRLLEYPHPGELDPETGQALMSTDPRKDRRNPIMYDVVLADEYNMVNNEVHRNLFDATRPGGLIRVFGDANQLPPIESSPRLQAESSPFEKLLKQFDGVRLKTIHRQTEGSSIVLNGHRIINGLMPQRADDFHMKITDEPVEAIRDHVQDTITDDYHADYSSITCQIISPSNVGWIGTRALNSMMQSMYMAGEKDFFEITRHTWEDEPTMPMYIGDKVIYTKNNYALGVFNGETGIVIELDEIGQVIVDFDDKVIAVPPLLEMTSSKGTYNMNPQKDLDLAYVITTHKSQGSEYDKVCYVMNKSRAYNLNRRNLYTGLLRAREEVMLISDQRGLSMSLYKKNVPVKKRRTLA